MIRSCPLFVIVLALVGSISLASAAAPQPGRGVKTVARTSYGPVELYRESWALVVGINDYVNWPKLRFARADAEAVARMLTEKLGFPKDHVFTLYDRDATRQAILGILEDRFANPDLVGPEDRVLIYFAGHGDTRQERGYLMPVDAEQGKGYSATAISMQELKDIIAVDRVRAKHLYLVTDACYSGMLFVARGSGVEKDHPRYIQEVTRRKARQALTAGGKEPVSDSGRNGHSVFTAWFLDAMGGGLADLNGDGFITAAEISGFLPSRVANDLTSQQTPESGDLPGSEGGEFVFTVTPSAEEEAKRAQVEAEKARQEADRRAQMEAEQAKKKTAEEVERLKQQIEAEKAMQETGQKVQEAERLRQELERLKGQQTRPQGAPANVDSAITEALIKAAEKGHTATVQTLLAQGAHVNAKSKEGLTALMLAALNGYTATVQALLAQGADANAKKNYGSTALMLAALNDHTAAVQALLAQGADANAKDNYGETALMRAARKGLNATVQALLAQGADANAKDNYGETALIKAAEEDQAATVQVLLDSGAEMNARSNNGTTALMRASGKGHTATVQALLSKGADVNAKDKDGYTVLMYAAEKGHTAAVQALLSKGADVNAKSEGGWTALMRAAAEGQTATLQTLLENGADVNAKSNAGWTALMRAAREGHPDIVQLLKKAGARE